MEYEQGRFKVWETHPITNERLELLSNDCITLEEARMFAWSATRTGSTLADVYEDGAFVGSYSWSDDSYDDFL